MKKLLVVIILVFTITNCKQEPNNTSNYKDSAIENKVDDLLSKMSFEEKIEQLNLRGTSSRVKGELPEELKQMVRDGKVGAFLNVMNMDYVNELQKIAVEESPNGIPLIFSRDVIHGFKSISPIPLDIAATWDEETARIGARVSAYEASASGVRWTFAPMLDIARDSRWGRIAESPGENPYLASVLAKGYVEGFQGDSLNDPTSVAAFAKHFIAYVAAVGGRDYNTAILSEPLLRNVYLLPFQTVIDAGAQTVMTSFNEVNGVPASGSAFILDEVLRGEMNFNGFVVSDWDSAIEMIKHGFSEDEKHAAELAVNASLDMEMTSKSYENNIIELVEEGKIKKEQIDFLVKNILRVKFRLGLFNTPFVPKEHDGKLYSNIKLSTNELSGDNTLTVSASIKNIGVRDGEEIAQLYIQDLVGSLTRPVRELKGFERVALKVGESKTVTFKVTKDDLKFVNNTMKYVVEAGKYNVWIASDAASGLKETFNYK